MFASCKRARPSLWQVAVVVAAVLVLPACGEQSDQADADLSGLKVYRHSEDGAPVSLDPVRAASIFANQVVLNTFDTLYGYKYLARPYELKPNLAVDFPEISSDGLTYTIRIKPGVRFIDDPAFVQGKGRELVAEDFVYSIKRHFDPASRPQGTWLWQGRIVGLDAWKSAGADYSSPVEGLRAIDRYTVEIKLTRPYPQLVYTLAMGFSAVVPGEAVEHYGKEFSIHPVGSGPFKLVSFDTSKVILVPNEYYRQEPVDIWAEGYDPETQKFTGVETIHGRSPPFLDRLEIHFIKETSARWNSFTKGNEIQYTWVPTEQVDQVLSAKDPVTLKPEFAQRFHSDVTIEAGFVFMSFNMNFPEFGYHPDPEQERRNKALRCAVIKAFDWQRRNESFYFGLGKVFPGIIVPVSPEYDPDFTDGSIERDVPGARRLLAENGWTPDKLPELVYGNTADVTHRLMYEQFRAFLIEIGYPPEKVVLKQFATYGDMSKEWKESRLPYIAKGWALDFPDAENTLQLFYGPNGSPGSNDANYRNPEYDRLYEQASVMLPSPERTAIYYKMNRILIDDCVAITGLSRIRIFLWHKNVLGLPDRQIVGGFFMKYVDIADSS